jgi:GTP-binding protein HflX
VAADLILHVRDMANPGNQARKRQVLEVLAELGIEAGERPMLEVWNKWDMLSEEQRGELEAIAAADDMVVSVSAETGFGVDALLRRMDTLLTSQAQLHEFVISASDGQRLAWLHSHGDMIADEDGGEGENGPLRRISVRLSPKELGRFETL